MDAVYLAEKLFRVIRYFKLYRTGTLGPAKKTGAK